MCRKGVVMFRLPALPDIASDLGVTRINDSQFVISVFFAGMAIGQLFFGPLSDSIGRRPAIMAGFFVFAAGCVLSLLATDFSMMLLGRFLQGMPEGTILAADGLLIELPVGSDEIESQQLFER